MSPSDDAVYPHAADLALIPCELAPERDRGSFELTPELCRFDGALYGGTGVAATVMAMEAATQRDALWVVTQFVAQTRVESGVHSGLEVLYGGALGALVTLVVFQVFA